MYVGSISKQGLLSTCCLGDVSLGVCAFAGEFAKNRAADDKRGTHQADRCYGFAQKDGREHDGRKRLEEPTTATVWTGSLATALK